MKKENNASKPIPDQIIEEVFDVIRKEKDFDGEIIDGLEKLWRSGELKRAERIIRVIKPESEDQS